eukprot:GHVS01078406.1.p2 GENE.GHVS01078406.1~~GHVS01078406.1.p2  ORF type:complete len:262 (+),score=50.76 GHVS01078406.1:31-816(+)
MEGEFEYASRQLNRRQRVSGRETKQEEKKKEERRLEAQRRTSSMVEQSRDRRQEFRMKRGEDEQEEEGKVWRDMLVITKQPDQREAEDEGDKMRLPPSILEDLCSISAEVPWTFGVTLASSGRRSHGGVLEFTAAEGTVVLPGKLRRSLGLPLDAPQAVVHIAHKQLPKGTFARFETSSDRLLDVPDIRARLERWLSSHLSVLTVGDEFEVGRGSGGFVVRVAALLPQDAVSITDTEVADRRRTLYMYYVDVMCVCVLSVC